MRMLHHSHRKPFAGVSPTRHLPPGQTIARRPAKLHGFLIVLFLLIALIGAVRSFGATYYIDATTANDSGAGTSTNTAWKRHPGMTGFGGSYTHAAGDRFIFRGGVTNTLAMTIDDGGTSGNRDYYGVDRSWYIGGAWARPIFDLGGSGTGIRIGDRLEHITIDAFEIRNVAPYCIFMQGSQNTTITNCYLHTWFHTDLPDSWQFAGGAVNYVNYYAADQCGVTNLLVTHSIIENQNGESCGSALAHISHVVSNNISYNAQLLMYGNQVVDGNVIHHPTASISGDSTTHPNVCYFAIANGWAQSPKDRYFVNNWLHSWRESGGTFPMLYISGMGTWGATNRVFVVNNVFQMAYSVALFENEEDYNTDLASFECYFWNNSFYQSGNSVYQLADRYGLKVKYVESINNHCVDGSWNYNPASAKNPTGAWSNYFVSNDLLQSQAAAEAQGYASNTFLYPTASGGTVGTGSNLTSRLSQSVVNATTSRGGLVGAIARPASGDWNAGAYQYASGSEPEPGAPTSTYPGHSIKTGDQLKNH